MRTLERFWAKVQKTDTCWLWTAGKNGGLGEGGRGYGTFWLDGRTQPAHIIAWRLSGRRIPYAAHKRAEEKEAAEAVGP
jgi:hypothetical protein